MSNNAWETTSPTSLHPLTHFFYAMIRYLAAYNDVSDVVSQALLLARSLHGLHLLRYEGYFLVGQPILRIELLVDVGHREAPVDVAVRGEVL